MSVSIDDDPNEVEDARAVLAGWLDDYAAGRCDRDDMHASFLSVCRSNPEAPWDALALLDQYQRRGKIDAALARTLKSDIAQLVFGVATQTEAPRDTTEATLDTTGTRWRKLVAEREIPPASAEDTSDLTRVRPEPKASAAPPAAPREPEIALPRESAERSRSERPVSRDGKPRGTRDVLRDRYELQGVLGQGNSGTVYKALDRHKAHLAINNRFVAVKVLKRSYEDRATLAELEREFHQAQALSHPNVVSVFDLDKDDDTYFIVMELLEGELLSSVLHRLNHEPMRRSQAMILIAAIGAALKHAHARSVIHGDLKPANVMITSGGEIRVLDFGFARTRTPHTGQHSDIISTGAPAYASMERIHGQALDASDDVYSFACIAYELLSGRHPYGGRSAVLARAHGKRPPRIEDLTNKQWRVLSDALAWDRAERRIDIADLLNGLGCTEGAAVALLPQQIQTGSDSTSRKWGVWAALLFLLIASAAATFFITEVPAPPADTEADRSSTSTTSNQSFVAAPQSTTDASAPAPSSEAQPRTSAPRRTDDVQPSAPAPATKSPAVTAPAVTAVHSEPQKSVEHSTERESTSTPTPIAAAPAAEPPNTSPPANTAATTIEFEKDTYVATESDAAVRLVVKRTGSTRQAVKFRWSLKGNSAEAGTDFAAIGPGIEEIPAGARTVHLTIPLVSDAIAENTELFLVELAPVDDTTALGEVSHAAVIIVDDD